MPKSFLRSFFTALSLAFLSGVVGSLGIASAADLVAPTPLLKPGQPVDWWFVFKFNTASFPGCPANNKDERACPFGGSVQHTPRYETKGGDKGFSQQFVYASSKHTAPQKGNQCLGDSAEDPLGATFDQVYAHAYNYVIWNDQFDGDPGIAGCGKFCASPWAHSKGLLAWNDAGEGFVLQVTTPLWPSSASSNPASPYGNTLGCVATRNNVKVSQHFFSLKLTKDDVVKVLQGLNNIRIATDPNNAQLVKNGGPQEIKDLVKTLGKATNSKTPTKVVLSSGVTLISKPGSLGVPPWQMVSSVLDGAPLRVATWWESVRIYTTTDKTKISCWDKTVLPKKAGAVKIATSGQWGDQQFGLTGAAGNDYNHAKIGVSTSTDLHLSIFGDMNQEGHLTDNCGDKQNGRGGLFYVLDDKDLHTGIANLIKGKTAPNKPPAQ